MKVIMHVFTRGILQIIMDVIMEVILQVTMHSRDKKEARKNAVDSKYLTNSVEFLVLKNL